MKKIVFAILIGIIFSSASFAITPLKLSLWKEISAPSDTDVIGFELGFGTEFRYLKGASVNLVYGNIETVIGAQIGTVNIAKSVEGFQFGLVNITENMKGCQLGFINITENMKGIQIGFLNFIKNSKLPVMVLANAKFK